mmetsp:Transcript_47430/g.116209  ORF Transcript_47430/g.116209 Transcript_47430/m.116209 type:complete len:367 (+) Transcript_47430:36-1136(+)|eukprot:CAMPEP_0198360158 /NCGR_PEP_ID=MMETSP1450-20131203/137309_1 /TAXON_ID=753684 ORGANISM="Madagascaria erythrocladiodes, Strain CCMP3234" /NCGR_SAMPLE_ID=MMETSP1450 /ASSEMBLY_ACC=CAM_ASM_001115 /LENGTH=366 /DNA_ID=CAMNT_0044067131 /DNA_START=14 /DNA_END=1114 /DNA_ORIENTATION=+
MALQRTATSSSFRPRTVCDLLGLRRRALKLPNFAMMSTAVDQSMKAVTYSRYGGPEVLEFGEVAKPKVNDDDVLVRVRAASVNPLDLYIVLGKPYAVRTMTGFVNPRNPLIGSDLAGEVVEVGSKVTEFQRGDHVFGLKSGSYAQYISVKAHEIAKKPSCLNLDEAGGLAIAGVTALQGLRDAGKVRPGSKVLVNGASGGVGTFAVQVAKALGAEVDGVCSKRNVKTARLLGAKKVYDYEEEDFVQTEKRYDVIFDLIDNHSFEDYRRILTPNGTCVVAGMKTKNPWIFPPFLALGKWFSSLGKTQKITNLFAQVNKKDLVALQELIEAGGLKTVVDRKYGLEDIRKAFEYQAAGHTQGKVIIQVP